MIVPFFATCLTLCPAPQDPAGNDPFVLRVWPVRSIVATVPATDALPLRTFTGTDHDVRLVGRSEPCRSIEADVLAETLRAASGGEEVWEVEGGCSLDYVETGALLVYGPRSEVKRIKVTMDQLRAHWTRTVEVRARLYAWNAPAPSRTVVTADQLTEVTAGATPLWKSTVRTRSGQPAQLGGLRRTARPIEPNAMVTVDERTGTQIVVSPHAMVDSDELVVFCQLAMASRRESAMAVDSGTMSGRIPDGGALLYCVRSPKEHGDSFLLAVECRWLQPRPAPPAGTRFLPIGGLVSRALGDFQGLDEHGLPLAGDEGAPVAIDEGKLVDLIRNQVTPDAWDVNGTEIGSTRDTVTVMGAQASVEGARKMIVEQQKLWLRNTHVEMRTLLVGGDAKQNELYGVHFPALNGRAHVCMHGIERPDGEGARLTGIAAMIESWDEAGTGGARVEACLHDAPIGARAMTRFQHSGPLGRTDILDFGDGPTATVGGQSRRTRQLVRLVWPQ